MKPWSAHHFSGEMTMVRKITTMMLIGGSLLIAACNTVRGAGEDLGSAANATENAINK
jgi:predicted small secreted protein